MKKYFLHFLILFYCPAFSQSILDLTLDGSENGKSLPAYFQQLETRQQVQFYFLPDWIDNISFDERFKNRTLRSALDELFLGSDLNYIEVNQHMVVIVKDPSQALQRKTMIDAAITARRKIESVVIGIAGPTTPGKRFTLTGTVTDEKSKDPLIGVNVIISESKSGTTTDVNGKFQIRVPAGKHVLNFTYVNYDERVIDLAIYEDGNLDLVMNEVPTVLEEIVVRDRSTTTSVMGETKLSMREIKRAPALLGEADLIKQIQLLPGVSTAGEAASGFNVRGGSVDQNLILYDGMPVFNSSHVFGFFSAFNAEAIRDVSFYRGLIPAEFGGRISSVLDIRSKEGDFEKWGFSGGIGLIASNAQVSGPIAKGKTSVSASFRTTYSDWIINTVRSNYVNLKNSTVSFYDGSMKLAHKFNEKTKLTWSGYLSHDQFKLSNDSTYSWNNAMTSLKLDHFFTEKFTTSFTVGYGAYGYDVGDPDPLSGFDLTYQIKYPTSKLDFSLQKGTHKIAFGAQATYYDFNPGTMTPSTPQSNKKFIQIDHQKSLESGIYFSDQFEPIKRVHVDLGARLSNFRALGPANVYVYQAGVPRETVSLVDTLHFSSGESVKTFNGFEPRLGLRYEFTPEASVKMSYNRIYQYLHLVTNTTAVTPVDIWQPSGYYFEPQHADQVSIGYFRNFKERKYEAFVEVYYKNMYNVLDFKDGAQLLLNPAIETDLLQGAGRAYGIELQITKNTGRLTGSLNYAYSRSFRTIVGAFPEESINEGKEYPSNYDQPNIVNLTWRYNISRRYYFTGNFTYHTGRPITLPLSSFIVENIAVSSFSDRNQFRVPDYHRLDLGLVIEGSHKRKKLLDGTWTFSIYNVYGRKNPYSIFFQEVRPGILRPYRLAVIGTALPSISYSFKI